MTPLIVEEHRALVVVVVVVGRIMPVIVEEDKTLVVVVGRKAPAIWVVVIRSIQAQSSRNEISIFEY